MVIPNQPRRTNLWDTVHAVVLAGWAPTLRLAVILAVLTLGACAPSVAPHIVHLLP